MATYDKTRKAMLDARAEYQALKAKANIYDDVITLIADEGADGAIEILQERRDALQEPMDDAKQLDTLMTRRMLRYLRSSE